MNQQSKSLHKIEASTLWQGGLIAFIISIIITLMTMATAFLLMLFRSGEDGKRTTLFHTLYFTSTTSKNGATTMDFGFTGDLFPLFLIAGGLFFFIFTSFYFSKKLLCYRQQLIEERKNESM